jgi:hypothetical protein
VIARINFGRIFWLLFLVALAYGGWKFVPPYWQAWKVDEALREARNDASDLGTLNEGHRASREREVLERTRGRLRELGVVDQPDFPLELAFSPSYDLLYANYRVVIRHPLVNKTTVIDMRRKVSMPPVKGL